MLARRRKTQRKAEAKQGLGNGMCSAKDLEEGEFVIAHCDCHGHCHYYRIVVSIAIVIIIIVSCLVLCCVVLCCVVLPYFIASSMSWLALRLVFSCLDTIKDRKISP
jgi:hypothetical protein